MGSDCVFCKIVRDEAEATIVRSWLGGSTDAVTAFVPLNPVTDGHVIVVPCTHVADALENPLVTAAVMRRVAELAQAPCNIITSVGAEATQTVRHLHVHIIPRREGDGLMLPWSPTESRQRTLPVSDMIHTRDGQIFERKQRDPIPPTESRDDG